MLLNIMELKMWTMQIIKSIRILKELEVVFKVLFLREALDITTKSYLFLMKNYYPDTI